MYEFGDNIIIVAVENFRMHKIPPALNEVLIKLAPQQQRLFACDCAEHVLPYFEKFQPLDKRPRTAIEVARQYALGKVSQEVLNNARENAEGAAWEVGDLAWIGEKLVGASPKPQAAASAAATAEGCSLANLENAVESAVNTAIEAVVIGAVGIEAANAIWTEQWASVVEEVLQRYQAAEAQERAWQLEQATQYYLP
jgi:hypothetical protein